MLHILHKLGQLSFIIVCFTSISGFIFLENVSAVAPLKPSFSISCSGTGLNIGMSSVGADYYALRVDNTANFWDGSCPTSGWPAGDVCGNVVSPFSHVYNYAGTVNYHVWAHACNWSNECSVASEAFPSCSPPSTCTVATDSNYGGSTCSGVCANGYSNYPTCTPPPPPPPPPAFSASCLSPGTTLSTGSFATAGATYYALRVQNVTTNAMIVQNDYYTSTSYSGASVANNSYKIWAHACNAGGCSGPTHIDGVDQKTITCNPPVATVLVAPTITNLFPYNNNVYFSWNPVPGAEYYAIRIDNNADDPADSWQFDATTNPAESANCSNDSTTDGNLIPSTLSAKKGQDYCGNISKNVPLEYYASYIVSGAKNKIWIHARSADGTFGPATMVTYNGSPQQPTGLSATCDTSGNATISWNSVATANHYALRVDDLTPSSLFNENSFPANNSACVFDTVDADALLERTQSGYGTDYCGNMTNTSWSKTLTPGHTYKTWVHSKTDTGFGNLPYPERTFTCNTPIASCTVATDSNFGGPTCSGICANGYSNYPTCTAPSTCTVATDSNFGGPTCSGICANGGTSYPTCTPPTGSCTVATDSNFGGPTCSGVCANGGTSYPTCTPSTGSCTVATDSNFGGPTCSGVCANGGTSYPTCTSATLSADPTSCVIASGGSTCNVPFTWNISNASDPNLYNVTRNVQYTTSPSGSSVNYAITNGINNIQARNGTTNLGSIPVTASCVSGTTWTSGSCVPISPSPCTTSPLLNCILPTPTASGNTVGGNCSVGTAVCGATCNNGTWINPTGICLAPATPELKATPRLVSYGGAGTLTWDTNGTNEAGCSITGGSLGTSQSPLTAGGNADPSTGSLSVPLIYGKTTYVLTCGTEFSTATFEVPSKGFET